MLAVMVVISGVLAVAVTGSVNYCGAKMCAYTNAHTLCRYPEGPSPKCVGYNETRLRSDDKIKLLSRLNRHRNVAAGGGMRGYPPAGNMLKLRWVDELAREAQRWADQCRPPRPVEEHDTCRDLYSMPVGQCVASIVGQPPLSRVDSMVDIWYIQGMQYKGNVTYYVPPRKGGKYYGDFAQTMWAKSYMVGCGYSRFMTPRKGRLQSVERLVCNIAPYGPQPTQPLWTVAAPTVLCPTHSRQSPVWHSLCDYSETVRELKEALERIENDLDPRNRRDRRGMQKSLKQLEAISREYKENPSNESENVDQIVNYLKLIPSWPEDPSKASIASRVMPSLMIVLAICL